MYKSNKTSYFSYILGYFIRLFYSLQCLIQFCLTMTLYHTSPLSSGEAFYHTVVCRRRVPKILLHEVLHGEIWALGVCRET